MKTPLIEFYDSLIFNRHCLFAPCNVITYLMILLRNVFYPGTIFPTSVYELIRLWMNSQVLIIKLVETS